MFVLINVCVGCGVRNFVVFSRANVFRCDSSVYVFEVFSTFLRCYAGLRSRSRSWSESEVLGRSRSRTVKRTRSRSRNILSDSDSSCPTFYILVMLTAQLTRPRAPVECFAVIFLREPCRVSRDTARDS